MKQYLNLLSETLNYGDKKGDRTGTGTISLFGEQMKFDLRKGFPIVTTKKIHMKSVIHELLWLLSGDTNIQYLKDNKVRIWDEWANPNGDLGAVYGEQWRRWKTPKGEIDQIKNVLERIKVKPDCRRLIVTAWNPNAIPDDGLSFEENIKNGKGALPPCHAFFQLFSVEMHPNDRAHEFRKKYPKLSYDIKPSEIVSKMDEMNFPTRYIDLKLYQRSADLFLGVPFNIASYSLLLMMIGQEVNMIPRNFVHTFGDSHIYSNHIEQVKLQLSREPMSLPTVELNPNAKNVLDFKYEDFKIVNYNHHPHIKGKVAV